MAIGSSSIRPVSSFADPFPLFFYLAEREKEEKLLQFNRLVGANNFLDNFVTSDVYLVVF